MGLGAVDINQTLRPYCTISAARIGGAYRITEKQERYEQIEAIRDEVIATLVAEDETLDSEISDIFSGLEKNIVRVGISWRTTYRGVKRHGVH